MHEVPTSWNLYGLEGYVYKESYIHVTSGKRQIAIFSHYFSFFSSYQHMTHQHNLKSSVKKEKENNF